MRAVAYGEDATWLDLDRALPEARLSMAAALRAALPDADVVLGVDALVVHGLPPAAATRVDVARIASEARGGTAPVGVEHRVRVVYDGPDLDEVAAAIGIDRDEVVRAHTSRSHRVELLGFLPGFAYLGGVDPRLDLPRRGTPRTVVPANAVAVAGGYTGVYPAASPGGWHLVGRAVGFEAFDVGREPPALFALGDTVRFVAVPASASDEGTATDAETDTDTDTDTDKVTDKVTDTHAAMATATASPKQTHARRGTSSGLAMTVIAAPPGTTVQDSGRHGWRGRGLPPSGPLDAVAHVAANLAVGNAPGAAAIEVPLGAARFAAETPLVVSIDGDAPRQVAAGGAIEVPAATRAVRYLAVAGAVDVPVVLGARATLLSARLGGLEGRMLRAGDRIPVGGAQAAAMVAEAERDRSGASASTLLPTPADASSARTAPGAALPTVLEAMLGPRADLFPAEARRAFFGEVWRVSRAGDRVGVRLEGARLAMPSAAAAPAPMVRGAVQVTTAGTPIVLGPDHPTTGGYPVLAVLLRQAQAALARLRPGAEVRFRLVE